MSEPEAPLDRRELFALGWRRGAGQADAPRSRRWIRPPHALPEAEFLALCTGCGDCITACPHDVVFALPAGAGLRAETTPALDLLKKGCHMCDGWPCVAACETGALVLPDQAGGPPPRLALAEVDTTACLAWLGPECGACAHACPVPGALEWDSGTRPVINTDACTGCALCREACIAEPRAIRVSARLRDREPGENQQNSKAF
ncbi:MAG: 4Fe-4S dicluster domain-containing protein [Paracoccaceae bacterium]